MLRRRTFRGPLLAGVFTLMSGLLLASGGWALDLERLGRALTQGPREPVGDLWFEETKDLDQVHCTASRANVSPDGAYVALWRRRIDRIQGPAFDLSVLSIDCLAQQRAMGQCVIKAYETNASPTMVVWSKNSAYLYLVGPQIDIRRTAAPGFRLSGGEHVLVQSNTAASAIDLAAPSGEASLLEDAPRMLADMDAMQSQYPGAELSNLRVGGAPTEASGLGFDESDFTARLFQANGSRRLPLPYPWISGARLQTTVDGPALWQNGTLTPIGASGLTAPIEKGAGVVRDNNTGLVVAVFREDGRVKPIGGAAKRPRIFAAGEAATASVWDYSESADGDVRVAVVSDLNRGRSIRINAGRRHSAYGCEAELSHRAVTRRVMDLGDRTWPLPARLYSGRRPKGLVVFFPGGPGSPIAQDARFRRIRPLLDDGYDVLVVAQSGSSDEGLGVVSRLAIEGGPALDKDAALVLRALGKSGLARYRHRVVFAESFGGMAAMALRAAEPGGSVQIDGYVLGAPWLSPRDPRSWAGTRGYGGFNPEAQVKWDKAMVGLDWSLPDDPMRRWARDRAATLTKAGKVTIIYGLQDPTFKPADVAGGADLVAIGYGDHATTLTSTEFMQALRAAVNRYAP